MKIQGPDISVKFLGANGLGYISDIPFKVKEKYCIFHSPGSIMLCRPLWVLEAAYSTPGNAVPSHIMGDTKGCQF